MNASEKHILHTKGLEAKASPKVWPSNFSGLPERSFPIQRWRERDLTQRALLTHMRRTLAVTPDGDRFIAFILCIGQLKFYRAVLPVFDRTVKTRQEPSEKDCDPGWI